MKGNGGGGSVCAMGSSFALDESKEALGERSSALSGSEGESVAEGSESFGGEGGLS